MVSRRNHHRRRRWKHGCKGGRGGVWGRGRRLRGTHWHGGWSQGGQWRRGRRQRSHVLRRGIEWWGGERWVGEGGPVGLGDLIWTQWWPLLDLLQRKAPSQQWLPLVLEWCHGGHHLVSLLSFCQWWRLSSFDAIGVFNLLVWSLLELMGGFGEMWSCLVSALWGYEHKYISIWERIKQEWDSGRKQGKKILIWIWWQGVEIGNWKLESGLKLPRVHHNEA